MARTPKTGRHGATRHSTHPVGKGGGFVLGVNDTGYHDSSLAVVDRACEIAYAAAEERYTRYKKESRFPRHELRIVADNFPGIEAIGVAGAVPIRMPEKPDPFWHDERLMLDDVFPVKPLSFDTKPFERSGPGGRSPLRPSPLPRGGRLFHERIGPGARHHGRRGMKAACGSAGVDTARRGAGSSSAGRLQPLRPLVRLYTDVTAILVSAIPARGKITAPGRPRGKPNPRAELNYSNRAGTEPRAIPLYFGVGLHVDELRRASR